MTIIVQNQYQKNDQGRKMPTITEERFSDDDDEESVLN